MVFLEQFQYAYRKAKYIFCAKYQLVVCEKKLRIVIIRLGTLRSAPVFYSTLALLYYYVKKYFLFESNTMTRNCTCIKDTLKRETRNIRS